MDGTEDPGPAEAALTAELAALRAEVARLNRHRFVKVANSFWRQMGLQFARGLAFGLGTFIGASILVSVLVYFLAQVELIPIIGDWAAEIARQIESSRAP